MEKVRVLGRPGAESENQTDPNLTLPSDHFDHNQPSSFSALQPVNGEDFVSIHR